MALLDTNYKKIRLTAVAATLVAVTLCALTKNYNGFMNVVGMYASALLLGVLLWKFPIRLYLYSLGFVWLASFGSLLGVYRSFEPYDKIIHFISGIILWECGYFIIKSMLKYLKEKEHRLISFSFATLFSIASAGVWEIFEFTVDVISDAGVQGGNTDTMGDIVAGTLGAIVYLTGFIIYHKIKKDRG